MEAPAAKAAAKAEDFDDMFGGDDEEEELNDDGENAAEAAATKARQARMVSMIRGIIVSCGNCELMHSNLCTGSSS